MQLVFHGGAREVGRSCIELRGSRRLLLDCGLKISEHETEYPVGFTTVNDIDAVFITHAHLDHTGALPWMDHKGMACPIFMTKTTRDLTRLILRDAFKVGKITHQHLGYDEVDIKKVLHCITRVVADTKGSVKDVDFEFFDAGHIPGSAYVLLETEGKKILYTGDINTAETLLLHAAETLPQVDVLICESTYGYKEHPLRTKTESEFIAKINQVISGGGSCIIPVFAIGRAQEILLLLSKYKWKVPIYFDGMCIAATDIALSNPEDITDSDALQAALRKVKLVKKDSDRHTAVRTRSIIITTSGMLTGGPVTQYLKYLYNDYKSAILLTGYQAEHTNGRLLLEKNAVYLDGLKKQVKCQIAQYDFSAHAGMPQLKELVRSTNPKKVFFVHGEEHSVLALQEWADALGIESYAPKIGDIIDI